MMCTALQDPWENNTDKHVTLSPKYTGLLITNLETGVCFNEEQ